MAAWWNDMNRYGSRTRYGIPLRILVAMAAVVVLFTGSIGSGQASGTEKAYGLYQSDLLKYEGAKHAELSQGVSNIIRRGRQMYEITWTAMGDIMSYPGAGQELVFRKGAVYQGIPYGQPVHKGKYVGFNATLEEFAAAAADAESEMYTTLGENTWNFTMGNGDIKYGPFYSSDCSAFISYVWQLSGRYTTSMIAEETLKKGDKGYKDAKFQYVGDEVSDLKVGYALNKGSSHIILVYDIVYDRHGDILQVTTLEQTPPIMRLRIWGAGGNAGSLHDLQNKIDTAPYDIIKYKGMDQVTFEESPAVPLNSENYINRITEPVSAAAADSAVTGRARLPESSFPVEGWTYHKNGVSDVEFCVDGGEWRKMKTESCGELLRFSADAEISASGEHTVSVRGAGTGGTYTIAEFSVDIGGEPLSYNVCFDSLGDTTPSALKNEAIKAEFVLGSPAKSALSFNGWAISTGGVKGYEYKIDDGLWIPVEAGFRPDVYRSFKTYQEACSVYNQFYGGFGFGNLPGNGTYTIYMRGITDTNDVFDIAQIRVQLGAQTYRLFGIEMTRTAMLLTVGALVLLVALIFTIIFLVHKKRKHKREKNRAAEIAASSSELQNAPADIPSEAPVVPDGTEEDH